jgi:hypothetical protein
MTHTPSTVLPAEYRRALIEASKVDAGAPVGESKLRALEVQKAINKCHYEIPQFFKPGETHED